MNQEHEIGQSQVDTSPLEKLKVALQEYLASCPQENGEDPGMLTSFLIVTQEVNVVAGKSAYKRVVADFQPLAMTLGLITYADAYYRNQVAQNY